MRLRRWQVAMTAMVGVLAAGLVGYAAMTQDDGAAADAGGRVPTNTTEVTRGDMRIFETLEGQLGYGGQNSVSSRAVGTVTWVRAVGSVATRGGRLFAVDRKPVFVMYGRLPAYRALTVGDEGPDVEQFERNLAELGYTGFDVDEEYTSGTAAAVKKWQEDWDLEETGEVEFGSVFFARGPVRVGKVDVPVGGAVGAGQAVVTLTADRQSVTVDLEVTDLELVSGKPKVTVTMPDGSEVPGRVWKVSRVVETTGEDDEEKSTVAVTIRLLKRTKGTQLDSTPVDVRLESERRKKVLSVPVNALVADPTGGYAVVVVSGSKRKTIPVETGVFSDGRVEVISEDLRAGMLVEVPTS